MGPDNDADFGAFKTYAWITDEPLTQSNSAAPSLVNPLNEDRVRASVDSELERKGYLKVPRSEADFVVAFTLGARDRVRIRNYYDDFGYRYYGFYPGFRRFGPGYGGFGTRTSVRTITEGTLVVDIFDNRLKEAVWHGAATKRLSRDSNGQELIGEAVATLLGQFPDRDSMTELVSDLASS